MIRHAILSNANERTTAGTLASVTGADAASGTSVTGLYGTITIGTDGSYSYVVDNSNSTVQALDETDTLNEAFTVVVSDGAGGSVDDLSITINGSNDAYLFGCCSRSNAREAGVDGSGAVAVVNAGSADAIFKFDRCR